VEQLGLVVGVMVGVEEQLVLGPLLFYMQLAVVQVLETLGMLGVEWVLVEI
jgi:hypothetical protein